MIVVLTHKCFHFIVFVPYLGFRTTTTTTETQVENIVNCPAQSSNLQLLTFQTLNQCEDFFKRIKNSNYLPTSTSEQYFAVRRFFLQYLQASKISLKKTSLSWNLLRGLPNLYHLGSSASQTPFFSFCTQTEVCTGVQVFKWLFHLGNAPESSGCFYK